MVAWHFHYVLQHDINARHGIGVYVAISCNGFFFVNFFVVAKVIHNDTLRKLSHIWLQVKYENNWLLNYGY